MEDLPETDDDDVGDVSAEDVQNATVAIDTVVDPVDAATDATEVSASEAPPIVPVRADAAIRAMGTSLLLDSGATLYGSDVVAWLDAQEQRARDKIRTSNDPDKVRGAYARADMMARTRAAIQNGTLSGALDERALDHKHLVV